MGGRVGQMWGQSQLGDGAGNSPGCGKAGDNGRLSVGVEARMTDINRHRHHCGSPPLTIKSLF